MACAGVPLRGPEDEDGPDLDSPGRAHEGGAGAEAANGASAPADAALPQSPATGNASQEGRGCSAERAEPEGGNPGPGDPAAAPHVQRTDEEREMEAEAMLAGLEQDPVRVFMIMLENS